MSWTYQTSLNGEPQKQTRIPWLSFLIRLWVFIRGSTFQRPFVNTIISAAQKNNSPSTITEVVCLRLCGRKQAKCRGLLLFLLFFLPRGLCKHLPWHLAFFFEVSLQSTSLWLLTNKDHFQGSPAHWGGKITERHFHVELCIQRKLYVTNLTYYYYITWSDPLDFACHPEWCGVKDTPTAGS